MQDVNFKFEGMRKEQSFTIYPHSPGNTHFTIQSDKRIARIDAETGKGMLSKQCANGAYFMHLNAHLGAYEIQLTPEQLTEIKLTIIGNGKTLDLSGCCFADNSGQVKM